MNKISISFLFILSLFMASCSNNDEPETYPIKFGKMDYTIRFATTTRIDFTDGGGKYELKASNPDVLGSFYIDGENLLQKRHTQQRWNGDVGSGLLLACHKYGIS